MPGEIKKIEKVQGPYLSKKIASSKKFCEYFLLKFWVSALIDIINSAVKLFWNFKNKLLSGRRRHRFHFSGFSLNSRVLLSANFSRNIYHQ